MQKIGEYAFLGCDWQSPCKIAVNITDVKAWFNIDFYHVYSNPLHNLDAKLYVDGNEVSDLVIPEGVTEIKKYAFVNYYLNSITLPRSLKKIGMDAFGEHIDGYCCENVYIPDLNCWFELKGSIPIGKFLFVGEEMLTDLVIPEGITNVIFRLNKGLKSVTFPNSMTKIGTRAFSRCENLKTVNIPNSVTEIGENAFYDCNSLTKIEIPNSVTKVDDGAFSYCDSLKTVILGKSISEIGEQAFANQQVKDIFIGNPVPPKTYYDENPFYSYEGTLHVPINSKKTYSENPVWGKFSKIVEFDASGVEDVAAEEGIGFSVSGGVLTVKGVDGDVIEIYDMSGRLVHTGTESTVSGLSRGIYLLKAGNRTAKIRI